MNALRKRLRVVDDAGFGLAELGIYAVLSVVVLLISGTILISSIRTRNDVTDLTYAVSVGQLISNSVGEGVRNASGPTGTSDAVQRIGVKSEPFTATGELLRARVAVGSVGGEVQWQCQAWFFSPDTHAVYSATNTVEAIADPVSFSVVNGVHTPAVDSDNWLLLGEGIGLADGHPLVFGAGSSGTTGQASVALYFEVTRNETAIVLIPTTVVNRKIEADGIGPTVCY